MPNRVILRRLRKLTRQTRHNRTIFPETNFRRITVGAYFARAEPSGTSPGGTLRVTEGSGRNCELRAGRANDRGAGRGTFFCPGSPPRYNLNRRAGRENRPSAPPKERSPMHFPTSRPSGVFAAAVACLLASATVTLAQETASDAIFVTVQNPITSDAIQRIKNQINARINDPNPQRVVRTIVFDFNPGDKPASTPDFGPCSDLAVFISSGPLQGRNTIAFVHAPVTGHTVLPVLACKE